MDIYQKSLQLHKKLNGKFTITPKQHIKTKDDLSLLYTPGVARASTVIYNNPEQINRLTARNNLIAIVSDGSAVLGLGNIGSKSALPVMEGKAILFKEFGGVDAFPLCIDTQEADKIVEFIKLLTPTFAGINLEDISAPKCFEIEEKLRNNIDIPIFHDDQHGTAIVVGAALKNALRVVDKKLSKVKIVINGVGAAGTSIAKFLINMGAENILLCDINGILNKNYPKTCLHKYHEQLANITNKDDISGGLKLALKDADVFIGISKGDILGEEDIKQMAMDSIVFAMANPIPEIVPEKAKNGGAKVIATGRSDYPNQVNNVLAFPGIFRGALEIESPVISEQMKIAAANSLSEYIKEPTENYIIPSPIDKNAMIRLAYETALAGIREGLAKKYIDNKELLYLIQKKIGN